MVVLMDGERGLRRLESEATACHRWSNGAGDRYPAHVHDYEKVLYCEAGSIVFRLEAEDREVALEGGDRLVLAAGTWHSAVVGPAGCVCIEGRR